MVPATSSRARVQDMDRPNSSICLRTKILQLVYSGYVYPNQRIHIYCTVKLLVGSISISNIKETKHSAYLSLFPALVELVMSHL